MSEYSQNENCRILIVDDIPQSIQVIAGILQNKGYQMAFAQDGKSALEKVRQVKFDLILLDVMMPGMDGFEVTRILKASPDTKEIPVIMLTAKNEVAEILEGFEAGAVDYVTKPFNAAELLERVRTHIELKKKSDAEKELISRLKAALTEVHQLSGLLPICSSCKNIRNDEGYWQKLEQYLSDNSDMQFTYSLCPDCIKKLYPEMAQRLLKE
jgi:sigma-B regulation protein RsbU (phosphoserine phosphatase)